MLSTTEWNNSDTVKINSWTDFIVLFHPVLNENNKIENIEKVDVIKIIYENKKKSIKSADEKVVELKKTKKTKPVKKKLKAPRTLWVRKKKKSA